MKFTIVSNSEPITLPPVHTLRQYVDVPPVPVDNVPHFNTLQRLFNIDPPENQVDTKTRRPRRKRQIK